jgi:hypothetical protein
MMKTTVPFKNVIATISFLLAVLVTSVSAYSQVPELVFSTVALESGTAGEDGAKYRFSNVTTGIDAIVEIKGRSSSQVVLSSIDTSGAGLGYTYAFQPVLGIPGTAPANANWSMDFNLTFYKAGTNIKITISQFYVTGLDIDGDGVALSEWAQMNKLKSLDSALVNSLTFTKMGTSGQGDDYKIEGIIANSPGIDTSAKNVMATYKYENKDGIDFTIGARTNSTTTTAGMRLNSLWFRDFFNPLLPVKMMFFTAVLNNENKVALKWATATEENASHFIVEKSTDGRNYAEAGIVFANGTTSDIMNYSFTDNVTANQSGVIYYRLRSVDIDGKNELSAIRIIRISQLKANNVSIVTYPNPVSNEVRITIPANWQNKKVVYELINASGKTTKRAETASSSQTEKMNVSNLAPGFYIVRVSYDGQIAQQKIIKQ